MGFLRRCFLFLPQAANLRGSPLCHLYFALYFSLNTRMVREFQGGTHNEETEAIKEGDEEFAADQGYGETIGHASYPQQGGSSSHCRRHTTLCPGRTPA